ncbi:DNA-binding protein [Planctomycetota bacterium]|nr:DNA-binding protein [Planctomycetota bacterium]
MNPTIFIWARSRAGLTNKQIAKRLKISEEEINKWESGISTPSYDQMEILAYDLLNIPLAGLFTDEAPKELDVRGKFRYLFKSDFDIIEKSVFDVIEKTNYFQSVIEEIIGIGEKFNLNNILNSNASDSALIIKSIIRWDKIKKDNKSPDLRLEALREALSNIKIYVFKDAYKSEIISGFCLPSETAPVISINNSTTGNRQIFTLLHELTHVFLGTPSIEFKDQGNIKNLDKNKRSEEIFCNKVASEILVPFSELERLNLRRSDITAEKYQELADYFGVSRHVISIKLSEMGLILGTENETNLINWNLEFRKAARSNGTGNYYYNKRLYLGKSYISLIVKNYIEGKLDKNEAARNLKVKYENFDRLIGA